MKKIAILPAIAFLASCVVLPPLPEKVTERNLPLFLNYEAMDESAIILSEALRNYHEWYVPKENHKAMAQSGKGAYQMMGGYTSVTLAVENAMAGCKKHNKRYKNSHPCRIINIDGTWAVDY